jgi:hypothetical protein
MEKFARLLPLILLCLFLGKLMYFGASLESAAIVLGLIALAAFTEYNPKHKELQALRVILKEQAVNIEIVKKQLDETKTSMIGMKMNMGIKTSQKS